MSHPFLNLVKERDTWIKFAEDRIADEQVRIGNWKRERDDAFSHLSEDEKKSLSPEPPAAPPPPIVAPESAESETPSPSS